MPKSMQRRRRSSQEVQDEEAQRAAEAQAVEDAEESDDTEDAEVPENGAGRSGRNHEEDDEEEDEFNLQSNYVDRTEFEDYEGAPEPVDFDNPPEPASSRAERKLAQMMDLYEDRLRYQIGGKHYVHLYRDKPPEDEHGNTLSGYVCRTQERIDVDWIRERYGGGVYHISVWGPGKSKKTGKRINKNLASVYALEISGPPEITLKDAHFQGEEGIKRYQRFQARTAAQHRLDHAGRQFEEAGEEPENEEEEDDREDERYGRHRRSRRDFPGWSGNLARPAHDPYGARLMDEQLERSREDRIRAQQLEDEMRRSSGGLGKEEFSELIKELQNGNKQAFGQIRGMVESFVKAQKEKGDDKPFEMLVEVLREKDSKPKDDAEAKRLQGLLEAEKESRQELIDRHAQELERRDRTHTEELARRDKVHEKELSEIRSELSDARREAETARAEGLDKAAELIAKKEAAFSEERSKLLDQIALDKETAEKREHDLRERGERDLKAERQRTSDEKERSERDLKAEQARADRDLAEERRRTQDEKDRGERDYKEQRERYEARITSLKEQHDAFIATTEKGNEGVVGALKQQINQLESKVEEQRKDLDAKRDELNAERLRVVETKQEVATAKLEGKLAQNDLGGFTQTVEKVTSLGNLLGLKKPSEEAANAAEEASGVSGVIGKGMDVAREAIQSKEVRDLVGAVAERIQKAGAAAPEQPPPGMPPQTQPGGMPLFQQAWQAAQAEMHQNQQPAMPAPQPQPQPMPAAPPRPQVPPAGGTGGGGMTDAELEMLAEALRVEDERQAQQPPVPTSPEVEPLAPPDVPQPTETQPPPQPQGADGMIDSQALQQLIDQIEDMAEANIPVEQGADAILSQLGLGKSMVRAMMGDMTTDQIIGFLGVEPGMASLAGQQYFEKALEYIRAG